MQKTLNITGKSLGAVFVPKNTIIQGKTIVKENSLIVELQKGIPDIPYLVNIENDTYFLYSIPGEMNEKIVNGEKVLYGAPACQSVGRPETVKHFLAPKGWEPVEYSLAR